MDDANMRTFAADAPLLTDNRKRMATESAVAMENGDTLEFLDFVDLTLDFNPLLQQNHWVYAAPTSTFNFAYLKLRQVEAARRVIADVEARHAEIPEYKTALIASQLERVAARLERLGESL